MLCPETSVFLENHIDLIDRNSWATFFTILWAEGLKGHINNSQAQGMIDALDECGIEFSQRDREEALLKGLRTILIPRIVGRAKIVLINYFYQARNNWLGYNFEQLVTFIWNHAAELYLTIRITSDLRDTEISFN